PARGLARGAVPRHPGHAVFPADGGPSPAGGAPAPGPAAGRPARPGRAVGPSRHLPLKNLSKSQDCVCKQAETEQARGFGELTVILEVTARAAVRSATSGPRGR